MSLIRSFLPLNHLKRTSPLSTDFQELQNSEATLTIQLADTQKELSSRIGEISELSSRIDVIEYDLERERENAVNTECTLGNVKRELEESKCVLTGQV